MMQCAYGEEKRGDTNEMQNGGEGEEERGVWATDDEMEKVGCPDGFDKIPAHYQWHVRPHNNCMYIHKNSNGSVATQTFAEAQKICEDKNTRIFEPTNITQVKVVQKWLQEMAETDGWTSDAYKNLWINYQDMDMKASLIQTGAVLMESKYMGSLSTLQKMPDEWWSGSDPWWDQLSGFHCAAWGDNPKGNGVNKWTCDDSKLAVVCEASGSTEAHTLKKYLTNANYAGGEAERRGTDMMQNGKRADGPTNMMQNGKRADGSTNIMQNGKRAADETNMMQNGKRADGPTN